MATTVRMRTRERGAATVEALCALFVFIFVWAGVAYMGALYSAQLRSESEARRCAWLISVGACRGEVKGCAATLGGGGAGAKDDQLRKAGEEASGGGIVGKVIKGPLMAQLDKLFGKRAQASAGLEVPRPGVLGGKSVTVGSDYNLPCNTKPDTVEGLAESILKDLVGKK